MGVFAVDFRGRARNWWGFAGVYWSVIGHRLRVGAMGVKGKVQEWCRECGWGVEMWEKGAKEGMSQCSQMPTLRVDLYDL